MSETEGEVDSGKYGHDVLIRVIKLGGSLTDSQQLKKWLDSDLCNTAGRSVIVPGGGKFADQVRTAQKQWRFDDRVAHRMAILAMQQMACLLRGINRKLTFCWSVAEIRASIEANKTVVWMPDVEELDQAGVPASWDVTSDSLAAWLAKELSAAELYLVKSAPVVPALTVSQMAEAGIVDKAFPGFIEGTVFTLTVLNKQDVIPCKHE